MSNRLVIFHGVLGGWGWERFDGLGRVTAESSQEFETREECLADARKHPSAMRNTALEREDAAEVVAAA
jgi:hypothetical protein